MARRAKTIIGWQEWCGFPDLNLPAVKAKIDTGAKTSALHAYDIERFKEDGVDFVRFKVHPIARNNKLECECIAPLVDYRFVMSSNGKKEKRYVIKTTIDFLSHSIKAELTLTTRHNMAFRMLLGREALRKAKFTVDPAKSFILGKQSKVEDLYKEILS